MPIRALHNVLHHPCLDWSRQSVAILKISACLGIYFLYVGAFNLPGGGFHFTEYANAMAHGTPLDPSIIGQRDVGYPLLIWLSFYPYTGSFVPLTLINTLFAIAIPLMVYGLIGQNHPKAAYATALAAILSLVPYQFMKYIHHDHTYIFFEALTVFAVARFACRKRPQDVYIVLFAAIAASLTRPAGNWLIPVLLVVMGLVAPRQWKHCLCAFVLAAVALVAYQQHRHAISSTPSDKPLPSYMGCQVLYNPYINSRELGVTLSEQTGPNVAAVVQRLREAVGEKPMESRYVRDLIGSRNYSKEFIDTIFNHPTTDAFIASYFAHPNYEYHELLCTVLRDDDRLMFRAALDIAAAHPFYIARYSFRNLLHLLFMPGYLHARNTHEPFQRYEKPFLQITGPDIYQPVNIPENGLREISHVPQEHELRWLRFPQFIKSIWWRGYGMMIWGCMAAIFAAGGMVAWQAVRYWRGRVSIFRHRELVPVANAYLLTALVLFYNAVVTAVFVDPSYRYQYFIMLPALACSGLGGILLHAFFRPQVATVREVPRRNAGPVLAATIAMLAFWPVFLYMNL